MFDLAKALTRHETSWQAVADRLRTYYQVIANPQDLCFADWEMLFRCLEQFRPTRIIELGRSHGNSTFVFLDYCLRRGASLTSIDRDEAPFQTTLRRMREAGVTLPEGFLDQDLRVQDILDYRPGPLEADQRVLLFFDAHGGELGRHLAEVFIPWLSRGEQEAVVLVDDIHDLRYDAIGPRLFKLAHRWRSLASNYPEMLELGPLWESVPPVSAQEALKLGTGRDPVTDEAYGCCGCFVTFSVVPEGATRGARQGVLSVGR